MNDDQVSLRRRRAARVVQHSHGVTAYPEPHDAPVLPNGWAPLDPRDAAAVLRACDECPGGCRLRLRSLWEADNEFRVYCLDSESWRGVCAATLFATEHPHAQHAHAQGHNTRLLAITHTPEEAARIALDFLNWDLEADGSDWRLSLTPRTP